MTLDGALSIRCNVGKHSECSGEPPSEAMRKFLPPESQDARCACDCHAEEPEVEVCGFCGVRRPAPGMTACGTCA